ncbi:MAG: hypothetical protein ABW189_03340 [Rickettsiales bacterium]
MRAKAMVATLAPLALSGCYGAFLSKPAGLDSLSVKQMHAPKPPNLGGPPDDAPEVYKLGWNDGCKTGMGTMVTGAYKAFYKFTVHSELYGDPMYYNVWKDAYTYCRQRAFKWSWEPWDRKYYNPGNLCLICPED